jgi:ribosomal protein S18 acetylase RimI-like enzyme
MATLAGMRKSPNLPDNPDTAWKIEWYDGPRQALRPLFELADDSPKQIDSYLEAGRILVARADGAVIGHALLVAGEQADEVDLRSIAVLDRFQGRGIGRALIRQAVAACRADRVRTVTVTTASADIDNIRFYQRCGFRVLAVERDMFTEDNGYPPGLSANGIAVRDGITFDLALNGASGDRATLGS